MPHHAPPEPPQRNETSGQTHSMPTLAGSAPALLMSSTPRSEQAASEVIAMLGAYYGAKFTDQYRTTDPAILTRVWGMALAGYRPSELAAGFAACRGMKWPPTLPEFLLACRPPIDADEAYHEACEQMPKRGTGKDAWSRAAIYHAACTMWFDLRTQPYPAVRGRWERTLQRAIAQVSAGELPDTVPPAPIAIRDDRVTTPMPDTVRSMLAGLVARLGGRA